MYEIGGGGRGDPIGVYIRVPPLSEPPPYNRNHGQIIPPPKKKNKKTLDPKA